METHRLSIPPIKAMREPVPEADIGNAFARRVVIKRTVKGARRVLPSVDMSTPPEVASVLGGWDIGISGDLLLQGIIFAQFAHYTALYKNDILLLRAFVWGLLFLTTLKSVQGLATIWIQNVQHFMDVEGAVALFQTAWFLQINVSFVAVIAFYVQMFFCYRLWVISKNIYMVALISVLFGFALLSAFVSTAFTFKSDFSPIDRWISIHLGTFVAGDLLLCGSTVYFLTQHSKEALPATAGMLAALLKLTIQSAAPAATCAFLNLIATQVPTKAKPFDGWSMISIIMNNWLPKLYAFSALWTLNTRKNIARSGGIMITSPEWHRYMDNLDLGSISGLTPRSIEVHTEVHTIQRADENLALDREVDFVHKALQGLREMKMKP
ncbi:hypothetical protein K438DRAFT_2017224 [Mycena galopus ATCC 62051]|nr:hypothetical protein K438DRAFT_2017224 [Mycena galopus ATCC 62051]